MNARESNLEQTLKHAIIHLAPKRWNGITNGFCGLIRGAYVIDRAVRLADVLPIQVLEDAFMVEGRTALADAAGVFADLSNNVETGLLRTGWTNDDVPHTIVRDAER
jgi:hypothetical protein